jgi:hypothetical protein
MRPILTILSLLHAVIVPKPSSRYFLVAAPTSVEFHQSAPSALYTLIVVNYKISPSVLLPSKASSSASLATKKVLGYVVTDGKSLFVTRDHITFDPQLFPFKLKPTSSPDWQTFYNLTNPVAEGAVLHKSPSATPENPMPDYASRRI